MAIDVFQSQSIEILLEQALSQSSGHVDSARALFQPKYFIVPNHGIGQWVQQRIAEKNGISANIKFVGLRTFQWELYQKVIGQQVVAEAPQMLNMKWRIYLFLSQFLSPQKTMPTELDALFQRVAQHTTHLTDQIQQSLKQQNMLYWIADQTSRLFANYIIYRGQCLNECPKTCRCRQNWLARWGNQQDIDIKNLVRKPDPEYLAAQPDSLSYAMAQAQELQTWQKYIWQSEFAEDFKEIQRIDDLFWGALSGEAATQHLSQLPKQIYLFTLLELPPSQFYFLRKLAQYISVKIFHYTPSQEFWADNVDPRWKAQYELRYPERAKYYDSYHALLTRLGKQARDLHSLLSQLAGGEFGDWVDTFIDYEPSNLLEKLQTDILHLREAQPHSYELVGSDDSIQIHVCHSVVRQLEVLKDRLIAWFAEDTDSKRQLSDVLILVPNLQDTETHIRAVFTPNYESNMPVLPIKIAGIASMDAVQLWQAMTLRIKLLQQRFSLDQLIDWLSLLSIQKLYALSFEDIQRITELLQAAKFKRGFDAEHLAQSLSPEDQDFRYTFRYALDRLSLSIAMPEHGVFNDVLAMPNIRPSDFGLIATLIQIYQDLDERRHWLDVKEVDQQLYIQDALALIAQELEHFGDAIAIEQVHTAVDKLKRIIRVSVDEQGNDEHPKRPLKLPLQYLLDEIENSIEHQIAQTEPTGQITFAQMGQLRPLPYQLIVCLNLDAGTFPNRDSHIPFDLMDVLQAELGDRSRMEDDQGAFLDALLQAEQGFWAFYNGFDVQDQEVRDPSSILQEFLAHLAQLMSKDEQAHAMISLDGIEIPSQLASLYHVHTLQPYDPKKYVKHDVNFQDQWFSVASSIVQPQRQPFYWINQANVYDQSSAQNIKAQTWIADLVFPARQFLRYADVGAVEQIEQLEDIEPIQLDGLQNYDLRNYLQQCYLQQSHLAQMFKSKITSFEMDGIVNQQLIQDQLPIGKMQNATIQLAMSELALVVKRLDNYGGQITSTTQQDWQLSPQYRFSIEVPEEASAKQWISLTASSCRNERALRHWLEYLLWRSYSNEAVDLQRIVLYKNLTLVIGGIEQDTAKQYLHDWLNVWERAKSQPCFLPPASFSQIKDLKFVLKADDFEQDFLTSKSYQNIENQWMDINQYQARQYTHASEDKACYLHHDWQLLISDERPKEVLQRFSSEYAASLYLPMIRHTQICEE